MKNEEVDTSEYIKIIFFLESYSHFYVGSMYNDIPLHLAWTAPSLRYHPSLCPTYSLRLSSLPCPLFLIYIALLPMQCFSLLITWAIPLQPSFQEFLAISTTSPPPPFPIFSSFVIPHMYCSIIIPATSNLFSSTFNALAYQ